ncbi:hypothetical protein [Rhizobium sp. PP-CC-3G-465]|uniref:hypothetical protein n=1 Tax=Rhizobium sp. PP-CC-3G-465 TaxID=2135648 RepID=UPI0010D749E6|nr:hypothetical protein C8J33_101921 [Rhizobium sp. PP-CC-3G-465]
MIDLPQNRYALRHDPDDTWAIEDIFTGQTAEVNDVPQEGLDMEIADDLVDLLNLEYINRRKGTTH